MIPLKKVALVGRTNVGKTTLFNRMTDQDALVSTVAGTTRDRKEGVCFWQGDSFLLVDTGGVDVSTDNIVDKKAILQTHKAIETSDVVVFVLDIKSGPLPQELALAKILRNSKKPVIVAANKADTPQLMTEVNNPEWHINGLPSPIAVSSTRGLGVGDLLDLIVQKLDVRGQTQQPDQTGEIKLAVIGRPNVGKSSLLNAFLGEERFIASEVAHTTREPNDALLEHEGSKFRLIDTAGLRKAKKKAKTLEMMGVERTQEVVERCDVALLVIDVSQPIQSQDRTVAGFLEHTNCGVVIIANKWDLVPDKGTDTINQFDRYLEAKFPFIKWAPIVFVSAINGKRVHAILEVAKRVHENRSRMVDELELDAFWRKAVTLHKPSLGKGAFPPKILGLSQVGTYPPSFELMIKARREDALQTSYVRFLENRLREQYDFEGTPIRFQLKLPAVRGKV